jgi:hypothetical protein
MRALRKMSAMVAMVGCGVAAFQAQPARAAGDLEHLGIGPGVTTSRECEASFAHALQAVDDPDQVVVTATAVSTLKGVEPLRFQKRAPWVRRLERIGKEGIAFVRLPRGPDRELVIGVNRKGVLGFQLRQLSDR